MNRVVLFGGTFDPPHVGHLTMAQLAWEQTGADEVWWLPAPAPPHKARQQVDDYGGRVEMVRALIEGYPHLRLCDIEASLPKPSYTVDTVRVLQTLYPRVSFSFLVGSDSLAQLPSWGRAKELARAIPFWVAVRSGWPFDETYAASRARLPELRAQRLEMPILDVSSTFLRERLERRLPVCGLVPDRVLRVWNKIHA
ncbi:MAG: nicotinate (nicotinamide) nucleotide adenylyltransferase [Alicyclobacillus macrosporangiidus]|uniref:nicotinate (nicotinamide) nucleotide adenylyltransferase n=1 Tax=Alicyclobacillus macrosporangiidus TaxID=392015 RepID=UPI0026EED876|nr:nicotinate (nicotinamide) nucleotide adenylyltransferase [Alicyclobacillus macrosporangiidus]MCL6598223.1 nicotinate (nicotinamide) nucleotide adenylyltransferase [Alicyclobacillus macrosporangiidus]